MIIITPDTIRYYKQAEELLKMNGMEGPALMTIRNALESLIKYLCRKCGINHDTRETDLSEMIDRLCSSGFITESTRSLMHKTRQLCNKGAHVDENISPYDASDAYKYMGDVIAAVSAGYSEESIIAANKANNVPMPYPDYYSQNRRYYGKWANCFTRRSLLMIPEYVQLERKAQGEGAEAVEACLDIASGFLSRNHEILWNDNGLINMPNYIHRGRAYNQAEAYDIRYYYWIMNAVMRAGMLIEKNECPMKYIATAVWEADIFWIHFYTAPYRNYYVSDITEYYDKSSGQYQYIPQYTDPLETAVNMFGDDYDAVLSTMAYYGYYSNVRKIRREVFAGMMDCNIVAPIFEDAARNPQFKLRFIEYCCKSFHNRVTNDQNDIFYLTGEEADEINHDYQLMRIVAPGCIPESMHVKEGDLITWDILAPYNVGVFCSKYYYDTRNYSDIAARQEKGKMRSAQSIFAGVKNLMRRG